MEIILIKNVIVSTLAGFTTTTPKRLLAVFFVTGNGMRLGKPLYYFNGSAIM